MNAADTRRLAIQIAYDGTSYAGWQRQLNAVSIQQIIEEAVEAQFGEKIHLQASGRTDAGVHAEGQIAAFDLKHPISPDRFRLAINARLPEDIRIMDAWEAPAGFAPRFDAKKKTYRYSFYTGETLPPKYRLTAIHERRKIDLPIIESALPLFLGEHDFAAFHSTGSTVDVHGSSTVRRIFEIRLETDPADPALHHLWVTGSGFLYNMVRIMAGTLLEIGCGKRSATDIEKAFQTGDRHFAGPTAPAKGLTLVSVEYPEKCAKCGKNA